MLMRSRPKQSRESVFRELPALRAPTACSNRAPSLTPTDDPRRWEPRPAQRLAHDGQTAAPRMRSQPAERVRQGEAVLATRRERRRERTKAQPAEETLPDENRVMTIHQSTPPLMEMSKFELDK